MTTPRTDRLAWFKSSYSGNQGQCLEAALDWRKSSHSGNQGGQCVEVAECPDTVHVRDSKDTTGLQLRFPAPGWSAFVDLIRPTA